jgi:hypothetical protein
MKRTVIVVTALILLMAEPSFAEEAQNVELIYPLTLRRPIIENEIDLTMSHTRNPSGRETALGAEIEYYPLSWWQIALGLPVSISSPGGGIMQAGIGDITLENKFLLYRNLERRIQAAGGFEVSFRRDPKAAAWAAKLPSNHFSSAARLLAPSM